ncbi:hypothetical protein DFH06DRAFT_1136953 [Mycena polygramma]|nr:hypothetical protein DFH06DRAFT_1136953 [Mycena polygramma]
MLHKAGSNANLRNPYAPGTIRVPFTGATGARKSPGGVSEPAGAGAGPGAGAGGSATEALVRAVGGDEPQVGHMSHRRQKLWSIENMSEDVKDQNEILTAETIRADNKKDAPMAEAHRSASAPASVSLAGLRAYNAPQYRDDAIVTSYRHRHITSSPKLTSPLRGVVRQQYSIVSSSQSPFNLFIPTAMALFLTHWFTTELENEYCWDFDIQFPNLYLKPKRKPDHISDGWDVCPARIFAPPGWEKEESADSPVWMLNDSMSRLPFGSTSASNISFA